MLQQAGNALHSPEVPAVAASAPAAKRLQLLIVRTVVSQQRSTLRQAQYAAIDKRRYRQELKVAGSVEHCHSLIGNKVDEFIIDETAKIKLAVPAILAGKLKAGTVLLPAMPAGIDRVVRELKPAILLEFRQCFGAESVDLALFEPDAGSTAALGQLLRHTGERRRTLLLSRVASQVGDKAWEKALSQMALPSIFEELLKEIKPGSRYMQAAGCDPAVLIRQNCRQLEQELTGIVLNAVHSVKLQLCKKVAQVFYEWYDHACGHDGSEIQHKLIRPKAHRQLKYVGGKLKQQAM